MVPGSSTVPAALAWFPAEGQKSARLIPESVLGLRPLKRGYVAEYDFGKAFVVQESSPEAAAAVMDKLRARFAQTSGPYRIHRPLSGPPVFHANGRYIVGYANVAEGRDPANWPPRWRRVCHNISHGIRSEARPFPSHPRHSVLSRRQGPARRASEFAEYRASETSRTPVQILAHIGDLLDWSLSVAKGKEEWYNSKPLPGTRKSRVSLPRWNDSTRIWHPMRSCTNRRRSCFRALSPMR